MRIFNYGKLLWNPIIGPRVLKISLLNPIKKKKAGFIKSVIIFGFLHIFWVSKISKNKRIEYAEKRKKELEDLEQAKNSEESDDAELL